MKLNRFAISLLLFVLGCEFIEYHPYEIRLDSDERDLNRKAYQSITTNHSQDDTIAFILTGDTQRSYDELDDLVAKANATPHDFVIVAGDISDFGLQREFRLVNERLKRLRKPYIAVIGNHDFSGNGRKVFEQMFGPVDDTLSVGNTKFIFLNTNSREAGFDGSVPNLDFLSSKLNDPEFTQAIVISHIPPFDSDFDPELEQPYQQLLGQDKRVTLSLHAHQHRFRASNHYDDHVHYVVSAAVEKRSFLLFTIWKDGYRFSEIPY